MNTTAIVTREVTDLIVATLTGISPTYYRSVGNIRDLNIIMARAQQQWDALLTVAKSQIIDPRWADIDFDKVNAELRDLRDQVGRLQAHIDRTQPVQANADGYVEPASETEFCIGVCEGLDERKHRDAAFESVRQRLVKLPRYSFHLRFDSFTPQRVNDPAGNWIEFDAAHQLFDPVAVDAAISMQSKTQVGSND